MPITVFLSGSPGLLNRGAGGPASLGHVLHSSIFSPTATELQQLNRGPEDPCCWELVFSTAYYLKLNDFLSSRGLYNCSIPTFFLWASQIALKSTRPRSRLYSDIPRPDALVIYTGAFPILTAWPGSICYTQIRKHRRKMANTNTGRHCCFRYELVYWLLDFGSSKRKRRHNS